MFAATRKPVEQRLLRDLVPLNALSEDRFRELAAKIIIEEVRSGSYLFRKGDRDNQSVYLLEGKINLIDGHRKVAGEVESGTDISRYAIAGQQPRPLSARAVKKSVIARIDSGLLDVFLTWDQTSSAEVEEIGGGDTSDWMTRLLQSESLSQLPPAKLQGLLMKMQPVPFKAGDVVIEEGSEGDYFYTIHEGRCAVTKLDRTSGVSRKLAELSGGDFFGEEALVTRNARNATVTMMTDGLLMRLGKQDFEELLQKELVRHVGFDEAEQLVLHGAVWLDVRTHDEYEQGAFEDSVNIPLANLRDELPELIFNAKYIICCDTGRRSDSAAFFLSHRGFDVYVLEGGINGEAAVDFRARSALEQAARPAAGNRQEAAVAAYATDKTGDTDVNNGELVQLQEEYAELQERFAGLQVLQQREHTENQELQTRIDQLRAELGESAETLTALNARVRELEADRESQHARFLAAQSEQTDQLQSTQLEIEHERHQCESLRRRIEVLSGEHAVLEEQLQARLVASNADEDGLDARLAEAQQQIRTLTGRLEESALQEEQAKSLYRQLDTQLGELLARNQGIESELGSRDGLIGEIRAEKAELEQQLAGLQQELVDHQERMNATLADADRRIADLQQALAARQEQLNAASQTEDTRIADLQGELDVQLQRVSDLQEQLLGNSRDQQLTSTELASFQDEINRLRSNLREQTTQLDEARHEVESLRAERGAAQQLRTQEQSADASEKQELMARISRLETELQNERESFSQTRSTQEQQYLEQVERSNAAMESHEQQRAELQARLESRQAELDQVRSDHAGLRTQLDEVEADRTQIRARVAVLEQELGRLTEQTEQQAGFLEDQVAATAEQVERLQSEIAAKDGQIETLRVEIGQHELAATVQQQENDLLRGQLQAMQGAYEQQEHAIHALEQNLQESVRKAHEDLKRKNENEKELQGQLDRVRKKLEQVTVDFHAVRKGDLDSADRLRDELHAERQARDEERASMAARQRELKEQLGAIASEHEVKINNQSGAIEEAVNAVRSEERQRLQGVLDSHAATEQLLENVQSELSQAHAELAEFHRQEKERHQVDVDHLVEINQQSEDTISQLQSQLQQLTEERDGVLEEQQALRDKLDVLRGEVEVARGLMNASANGKIEDPVQLRKQLDETRRNVEIAVRLRAEAETARDRMREERDRLLVKLDNGQRTVAHNVVPTVAAGQAGPMQLLPRVNPVTTASFPLSAGGLQTGTAAAPARPVIRRRGIAMLAASVLLMVAVVGGWLVYGDRIPWQLFVSAHVPAVSQDVQTDAVQPRVEPAVVQGDGTEKHSRKPAEPAVSAPAPAPGITTDARQQPAVAVAFTPVLGTYSDSLQSGGKGPSMVRLAAASFLMGSIGNSINAEEVPRHEVSLPAFSISSHEVTFAEYDKYARATGRRLPFDGAWGRGDQPVINVSWKDAQGYVRWLSEQSGKHYRLASEAEWEYAARAGNVGNYWWTEVYETIPANCFNCGSKWDGARTAPVGQFAANSFGLHDMAGNVQEWTADCYHSNYQGAPADGSIWDATACTQRVVRGGAYSSPLESLRSAKRAQLDEDTRLDNLGFRVVRTD